MNELETNENLLQDFNHFSLTIENDIAWLEIDVKEESANVISPEVINELDKACDVVPR